MVSQAAIRQVASPRVAVGVLSSPIPTIYRGVIMALQRLCQPQVLHPHQVTNAGWTFLSELIAVSQASTREDVRAADVVGFQSTPILPMHLGVSTKEARPPQHHRLQRHLLRPHLPHLLLPRRLLQHRLHQLHPLHHHHLDLCQIAIYSMQTSVKVM